MYVAAVNGEFTPGERYLVYGINYEDYGTPDPNDDVFLVHFSNGTKLLESADADLQFLASAALTQGGMLYGAVTERQPDVQRSRLIDRPAGGILLRANGPGGSIDTISADDGRYFLAGLPPGQYAIEPALSDIYKSPPTQAEIKHNGCTKHDVIIIPNQER